MPKAFSYLIAPPGLNGLIWGALDCGCYTLKNKSFSFNSNSSIKNYFWSKMFGCFKLTSSGCECGVPMRGDGWLLYGDMFGLPGLCRIALLGIGLWAISGLGACIEFPIGDCTDICIMFVCCPGFPIGDCTIGIIFVCWPEFPSGDCADITPGWLMGDIICCGCCWAYIFNWLLNF